MTSRKPFLQSAAVAGLLFAVVPTVFALGFRNPDQSAKATGQGEAFVAQADDASAIYYNPAGLTQLKGTQLTSGGYLTFRNIRFNGAAANERLNDPAFTGHAYAASDLGLEHWRFGLGFNIPFGTETKWGKNSTFRYIATDSQLRVFNIAPAIACKVNENLSLGVALNIYDGYTELNRRVPFSILINPLLPDGRFRFDGDGQALGATAGVMYHINEQHTVGAVYRSPFAIDFEGRAVVKDDPTTLFGPSPASAEIDFPQSVAVGWAWRPNNKLKLEADVEWTNWDTLNTVRLRSPNPAFATDPSATIPFHWRDSFFYEFGAQYTITDRWTARTGYIFSENTVPNRTFNPTVPDSDRHVFSIGIGYHSDRLVVDLVYQYSLSESRTVTGSADTNFDGFGDLDGKWKSDSHAITTTATLKF